MQEFTLYPAIDLRGGQVVRLQEGDPNRQTQYSNDPAATAARWINQGARWLHVVNLDGAFGEGDQANQNALQSIVQAASAAGVPVQFGGGLRSLAAIQAALALGVARVVTGTLALDEAVLAEALRRWGAEQVAVSLDAKDGRVQVHGWQTGTDHLAVDTAQRLRAQGLRWLVFTDIARDGLQSGLNLASTTELARVSGLSVIASGGVAGAQDIFDAQAAGLAGAIAGRALYEGQLDLQTTIQELERRSSELR